MAHDWQVEHPTGRCAITGRELAEGEEYYAVLFEEGESFLRADYSADGWEGPPEGSYCHFRTRVPIKTKKKQLLVDNDVLTNFFVRLADEEDPSRIRFRFVLALILMRKRLLRYDSSEVRDGEEYWRTTMPSDQSTHEVVNPRLTDDQIEDVSQQISAILHGDMGEWTELNDPEHKSDPGDDQTATAEASEQPHDPA